MLSIHDLGFSIAGKALFQAANARLPSGSRIGLVGRNGTGKTTLFGLIRGDMHPDQGEISLPPRARIGGVAQEAPADERSLIETVLAADTERAALMAESEHATDPHRIAEIQTRLADINAHSAEARAAAILAGLGFDHQAQKRASHEFSGGWRMRVALAAVLFSAPDLLLLDEPTNYLDLEGAAWLENYLARYPYTSLIISHDRGLLNRAVNGILHLHNRQLTLYSGGYDSFARVRNEKLALQAATARKQQAQRAHMQAFVDRFRYKASKAKQAQSRLKMLERMEPVTAVIENDVMPIAFPEPEDLSPPLMQIEDADAGYRGRVVLRGINLRIDQDDRIALLGANGQGKSTLAKLIAGRLVPMRGHRHAAPKLRIGYFAQHQGDELDANATPVAHIRRLRPDEPVARLRARLAAGGIGADIAETPVGNLSGGQKARLLLVLAAIDAPHLMILDEPTNHLDIDSREALISALNDYGGAIILITHDAHLVELVADRLWLVEKGQVHPYDSDIETYRQRVIAGNSAQEPRPAPARKPKKPAPLEKGDLSVLKSALAACETRLAKIADMRARLDVRLSDPDLYDGPSDELLMLQKKRHEIDLAQERAEMLWFEAQENLDRVTKGGADA